jgi:aminopeptidase-like protein
LTPGNLNYGEVRLPGETADEVLISTYVCHPSMANNELSGPVVTTEIVRWLRSMTGRRCSYRILFVPETIGSITYLSRHLAEMKERVIAGFNVTCIGDDRAYSYLPSRLGGTLADRAALHALGHHAGAGGFTRYSFLDRGSDERQYCSPGIDLPVASVMRSKYGAYPEYHTSLDDLSLISPDGLGGGIGALAKAILSVEANATYRATVLGEPQLGRRGLYPTLSALESSRKVRSMMTILAYADGKHDLLSIAEMLDVPVWELHPIARILLAHELLAECGNEQVRGQGQ